MTALCWARVGFALVNNVAPIVPVLQHQIEGAAGEMLAAGQPSAGSFTALAHDTQSVEFGLEQRDRAEFRIAPEDHAGGRGLRLTDDQFAERCSSTSDAMAICMRSIV
jgi:hypothetical protein